METIRENAEEAFAERIRELNAYGTYSRCLHLRFSELAWDADEWFPDVREEIKSVLTADKIEFFLCHDGDVFVLARSIDRKVLNKLLTHLSPLLTPTPIEGLVSLFETSFSMDKLLDIAEEKMVQKQARKKENLDMNTQKKKMRFLNLNNPTAAKQTISMRRAKHTNLEVLIVDDDPFVRKLVCAALEGDGFNVSTAENATEALHSFIRKAPHITFLDIGLPDADGHDVLNKLFEADPEAYVIMLSGYGNRENVIKSIKKGARGFVGKPFSKQKLMQYVQKCPAALKYINATPKENIYAQ